MLAHGHTHVAGNISRALQQRLRAGLDAVGCEHRAHKTSRRLLNPRGKPCGLIEPFQPARLIIDRANIACFISDLPTAAVGRPEVDTQAEVLRGLHCGVKFRNCLAPCAVEQRGDGKCCGDPVADQLRKGMALLEGQLFWRVHLVGASRHIGFWPDAPFFPCRAVIIAKDRRIDIRQRIKVDETGRDDGLPIVDALCDFARECRAHMQHALPLQHDHTVFKYDMMAVLMADHPAGSQKRPV